MSRRAIVIALLLAACQREESVPDASMSGGGTGGGGTGGAGGSGGGAGSLGCFGIGGGSEANLHADRSSYDFGTWIIGSTSPAATVHVSLGSVIASDFAGARAGEFELADAGCIDEVGFWCPRLLTFHPALGGAASATFELAGPGVGACVTVHGVGLEPNGLAASPAVLDFVAPAGLTSATADITVRNDATSSIGALSVDLTGDDAALFEKVNDGCNGSTLIAGSTCSVQVRYAPDAGVGHHFASLAITSSTPGGAVVSLRGVGMLGAALGWVDPNSVSVPVGMLGQLWLTIANIGTERTGTLGPTTIEGDDGGMYSIQWSSCDGHSLIPEQECAILADVIPQSPGPSSGSLVLTTDAGERWTIPVTATGQ